MLRAIQNWIEAHFLGSVVILVFLIGGWLAVRVLWGRRDARRRYRERERQRASFWGWD